MSEHKLVGYDVNGWYDSVAIGHPEEPEASTFKRGMVGGSVVNVGSHQEEWLGGEAAALAPHGRGAAWGPIGVSARRQRLHTVIGNVEHDASLLAAGIRALATDSTVGVVAIDDVGEVRDNHMERWVKAMRDAGCRQRRLHVWRPVLSALYALQSNLINNLDNVTVVSQAPSGVATQAIRIVQRDGIAMPERRGPGQLHKSDRWGMEGILQRVSSGIASASGIAATDTAYRAAVGAECGPELVRLQSGQWKVARPLAMGIDAQGGSEPLPASFAPRQCVLIETTATGGRRDAFVAAVMKQLTAKHDVRCIVLPFGAVAEGGLFAARRVHVDIPVYLDYLPQVKTIVMNPDLTAESKDLIPIGETVPAGQVYRTREPALFSIEKGTEQLDIYLYKELEPRPRLAKVDLPNRMKARSKITLRVEQTPAEGTAILKIEGDDLPYPITVDWNKATEITEKFIQRMENKK